MKRTRLFQQQHIRMDVNDNNSGDNPHGVAALQQQIVQNGLRWQQESLPDMVRVSGCVATVHILASVVGGNSNSVQLQGNADAVFSRGLLQLLADFLRTKNPTTVAQLDPQSIADVLGVRKALSKGRNDGLANMLTIVQRQINVTDDNRMETLSDTAALSAAKQPTVALLLSGGVDSSVALRLLLQQGYNVVPFYLKIWLEDELAHLGECPWEDDIQMCRQVCEQAGVDLQIVSLQDEYHQRVMQHTLNEAAMGRTPNPDILCNSRVKFGCFLEYLEKLPDQNFEYIASGHYAQLKRIENKDTNGNVEITAKLYRAPDAVKDQSYFLCALGQSQLQRLLFPIGHLEKSRVRELAEEFDLPNRQRPDSQGLCFLGKVKFRDFMQSHLGESPGPIVDALTGDRIGTHHGVWYHTVGQRKGIGPYLAPTATAFGPWYVVAKDPSNNIVYASNQYDEEVFVQARSVFHVENLHWIAGKAPAKLLNEDVTYRFTMKIRHGPKLMSGTLMVLDKEDEGTIHLDQMDGGLAPGQYVVFYTENAECVGGSIISEKHWAEFLAKTINTRDEQARLLQSE
jgi:tRNA-specific 2-thiouridylase